MFSRNRDFTASKFTEKGRIRLIVNLPESNDKHLREGKSNGPAKVVLVERAGVQYAIVADDNNHFLDPYWKAMYEVPSFVQVSPMDPPIAIGGSASAKKVNIGGKLGIVKDPFGKQGQPQYLGATLPLDGYGVINLSVSEDGKVLIGQLNGYFSANILDMQKKDNKNLAWSVDALINAALAMPEQDRMRKHLVVDARAAQNIPVPTQGNGTNGANGVVAAPAGTAFDPDVFVGDVEGRMGDVLEVDLRKAMVEAFARERAGLPNADEKSEAQMTVQEKKKLEEARAYAQREENSKNYQLEQGVLARQIGPNAQLQLLTDPKTKIKDTKPLSRAGKDNLEEADFNQTGRLYLVPNITQADENTLRNGGRLNDKTALITFRFEIKNAKGQWEWRQGSVAVVAKDIAKVNTFFGDRPLDNPGYSKANLSGAVGKQINAINKLDVYRIEQRLKYLGFGASSIQGSGGISVDGVLSNKEETTLRMFEEIVQGRSSYLQRTVSGRDGKSSTFTIAPYTVILTAQDVDWLNAYNAPHWMDFGSAFAKGGALAGAWVNKVAPDASTQGVSWVYDTMLAVQAQSGARTSDGIKLQFKGAGSLGTMLNLGINQQYISKDNQDQVAGKDIVLGWVPDSPPAVIAAEGKEAYQNNQWNYANAQALADLLRNPNLANNQGRTADNAQGANQQDKALQDFLAVYAATLNDGQVGNGLGWDDIGIASASSTPEKDQIKKALFGSGVQRSGLINASKVLLGGTAAPLGDAMTAQSLAKFMGDIAGVDYGQWVKPLQEAMAEFNINTPQRIAAFLAQVKAEGALRQAPESFVYSDPDRLAGLFKSAFSYQFNYDSHQSSAYRSKLAHDRYNDDSRTREQNAKLFYDEVVRPALAVADGKWTDSVQSLIANRVYSSDYGTGIDRDPFAGSQASGDGWKYRGHGQLQLTGKLVITQFADYVRDNYVEAGQTLEQAAALRQQIIDTPDILDTDKALAARSAGWVWSIQKGLNPSADQLSEAPMPWSPLNAYTTTVSKRIATAVESFKDRWESWQYNVKLAYSTGNPYDTLRATLHKLGIKSSNAKGYESQFGVGLSAPELVKIVSTKPLVAADSVADADAVTSAVEDASQNNLLQDLFIVAKQTLNLTEGAFTMLSLDQLHGPNMPSPTVIVAKADGIALGGSNAVRSVGVCEILNLTRHNVYTIHAEINARSIDKVTEKLAIDPYNAQVRVIQQPKHGKLVAPDGLIWINSKVSRDIGSGSYIPNAGFTGKDSFVMQVEGNGRKVKVHYFIAVTSQSGYIPGEHCKLLGSYKISQTDVDPPAPSADTLAVWQRSSELSALLADASQHFNFADLPGSSVGQTTGTGPSASITLDKDAAGHGWYIDETPLDNTDDYLPTSNPNIWQAKPGSEADGKMDMLSVLLHEYGHALGLEHSGDASDFMASTLQPGQRRLPSSQELALMSQLVAQIKADMQTADAGGTNTPTSDSAVTPFSALSSIPADPQLPPGTPVPSGVGLAALLAARQRREGLASALQASKQQTTPQAPSPQMQLAANLTLTNPQFSGSQGWESTGDVRLAQGMATLHETVSSQTRLNQAFVVGANDRVLSFTLTGLGLDDANNAPDDAFEVALIFDGVGFSTI
jgi:predicted chitinase